MNMDSTTFTFVFGLIFLFLAMSLACFRLLRRFSDSSNPTIFNTLSATPQASVELAVAERGLDEATLNTYPNLLYSEVIRKGTDSKNNYSSCSICLRDYKESDVLRMLPDCGHLYHLRCVDPWLKSHPTCPMCRSSSSVQTQNDNSNASMEATQ